MKIVLHGWAEVDKVHRSLRRKTLREARTADFIMAFDTAFRSAIAMTPLRKTSGMVEMYRLLPPPQ